MTKAQLFLDVDLAYADVPVPGKIFVPIEAGKFGPISYKSHNTDPLAVEKLIKDLLNRFLLKRLSEVIGADLDAPLEKAKGQINQPIRFQLEIGRGTAAYEFNPNLESFEPDLKISQ
ncbi:hypothetical protein L0337_15785 [candidate division KSB1 bacterium]|nr:hypothetical protein [candidate division KSB1 bacterium]